MKTKKLNLKIRIILSFILGLIAGIITFPTIWNDSSGNTPEEIRQVESAIEKLFQKQGEIDFIPDWSNVEKLTSSLVFENERIAEAKALMYYSDNPFLKPDHENRSELSGDNLLNEKHKEPNRFAGIMDGVNDNLWSERHKVSQQPWKIQTKSSRFLTSFGISIISCIGVSISTFLILTFIPIIPSLLFIFITKVWYFLLKKLTLLWVGGIILVISGYIYFFDPYLYEQLSSQDLMLQRRVYITILAIYLCSFNKIKEWLIKNTDLILKWAIIILIIAITFFIVCGPIIKIEHSKSSVL